MSNSSNLNNKSKLIQKINLSINNLINFKEIRIQRSFEKLKDEISVYCVSYNFKKSIERCLDSILRQIISIPIKIYCIDDGSSDGTQEILKKYAYKNKKIITLILSNTNTKKPGDLVIKCNFDFN